MLEARVKAIKKHIRTTRTDIMLNISIWSKIQGSSLTYLHTTNIETYQQRIENHPNRPKS